MRAQRSCVPDITKVVPCAVAVLGNGLCKSDQVVLILNKKGGHEEQLRLGTMRDQGRPLVKVQPQVQLIAQD